MLGSNLRIATKAVVVLGLLSAGSASAQNWVKQADMKVARVEATTVDYRDDIYVFNGFKPGIKIANSVEKYDVATKKWSIIGSTSTVLGNAVTHNGVIRNGADVWILGGRLGSHPGRVTNDVWIYNLDSRKWRKGPDLPKPSAGGGAALVNNKVHWIGGLDANARCDVASHFVYDLSKPNAGWKNITATAGIPSPRNHFSTAVVNGIIYVMGGQYGHDGCPGKRTQDTVLVHAFNPANNKWSQKASLPSKNSHTEPGTFVYKNEIYTVGGENAGSKVWKYNPKANKWSTFKTLPESLVAPIARIIDGRLIVAGGGAPTAAKASDTVRSLLVDNNPPASNYDSSPDPVQEPEPLPGSNAPKGETLISMEAEYFDINDSTSTHQWVHATKANSSNDGAMITTPDEGQLAATAKNTPMLGYMVYFNYPGKHYIWVRGLGDTNSAGVGNSDSIHIGLNGEIAETAYRIDQFPDQWTWSRHTPSDPIASINVVNAGVNTVNLWMREDGLAIDKFVITSDPDFVPDGFGPELSDGTDSYVSPIATDDEVVITDPSDDEVGVTDSSDAITAITDPNNDEINVTDQSNIATVITDSSSDEIVVSDLSEIVTVETDPVVTENGGSGNGLFGGGTSLFVLFGLLMLSLLRQTSNSLHTCRQAL